MGKPDGDITPGHLPVALLRTALEKCEEMEATACVVVLVDKDNSKCWYDACGHENQAVLWALENMKVDLLNLATKEDD